MIRFFLRKKLRASDGDMLLDVQCRLDQGQLLTIYGKSGAGKTSILRMLAGLLSPDRGIIEVHGQTWLNTVNRIGLRPQKRAIGYVFQDYALFPNMTVRENLQFGLEKGQDPQIVDELIHTIELEQLQHRKPDTLSGGQQQRVALARALVRRPKLLLLDEPLSALDKAMRLKLQDYILKVHRQFQLTTILVSHDLAEVFKLSDQVMCLEKGLVTAQGKPVEVFGQPQTQALQLVGEVLALHPASATILIGATMLDLPLTPDLAETLEVGREVLVSWSAATAQIELIR